MDQSITKVCFDLVAFSKILRWGNVWTSKTLQLTTKKYVIKVKTSSRLDLSKFDGAFRLRWRSTEVEKISGIRRIRPFTIKEEHLRD